MTLDEFVDQGFHDHADHPDEVFARLPDALPLVDSGPRALRLAHLATHVAGEHLGRWNDGLAFLERIVALPSFDAATPEGKGIRRFEAVLHFCAGRPNDAEASLALAQPGGAVRPESTRIRMLVVAASAFGYQDRTDEANASLDEALELAAYGPGKDDPAAREFAVTCHNIAAGLEIRPNLSAASKALTLRAARISRRYWEIVGDWTNVERAEYRLAMSHLAAGLPRDALPHASECLRVVVENGSDPVEAFFAHWTVSRVLVDLRDVSGARRERGLAAEFLPRVEDASLRAMCDEELAKLDAKIGR